MGGTIALKQLGRKCLVGSFLGTGGRYTIETLWGYELPDTKKPVLKLARAFLVAFWLIKFMNKPDHKLAVDSPRT